MATAVLSMKQIGHWDKGGRFHINEEFTTESSSYIRRPSRNFPFSEYKHVLTKKYAKQLSEKLGYPVEIVK